MNQTLQNSDLSFEEITPEKALEYLATSPANRNLTKQSILVYVDEIKEERWFAGNDAIVFDTQGRLRNGHHRLNAVVTSGTPAIFIVRRNVPEHEVIVFDTGKKRTLVDATVFDDKLDRSITKEDVQIANSMLTEGYRKRFRSFSNQELSDYIGLCREDIDFAKECFSRKIPRITVAPVLAVFARAHGTQDREKLRYAADFLMDGGYNSIKSQGSESLKNLREYLLRTAATSGPTRLEVYAKTENMLNFFLQGIDRSNVTMAKDELFPLKEDQVKTFNSSCGSIVDCNLMLKLKEVAKDLQHLQPVGPIELAEKLYKLGYRRGTSEYQESSISKYIAKLIKGSGDKFQIPGVGYLEPLTENMDCVKKYIFRKFDKENSMLSKLRSI